MLNAVKIAALCAALTLWALHVAQAAENVIYARANGETLVIDLAANSSAAALKELLEKGPRTVSMEDYGRMEKVGDLGTALPRNDESISTGPGDVILYQGRRFVIYYDTNHWNFTRLGTVRGATADWLKKVLGRGDVIVELSNVPFDK